MSGDRIDECKREIDRLKSQAVPLCLELDRITNLGEIQRLGERIFQEALPTVARVLHLNEEIHRHASRANALAARMVQLSCPGDPRAPVITRMADVTRHGLEITSRARELSQTAHKVLSEHPIDTFSQMLPQVLNGTAMIAPLIVEPRQLQERRNRLFKQYEELSSAYETGIAVTKVMSGDPIDDCKREIDQINKEIRPLCSQIDQTAIGQIQRLLPNIFEQALPTAAKVLQLNEEVHRRAAKANGLAAKMLQLVSKYPGDPRASVITRIAKVTKESLEITSRARELSQMAYDVVSANPEDTLEQMKNLIRDGLTQLMMHPMIVEPSKLQERRDRLFKQYEELSSEYETGIIDECKREIDRLKSEIVSRCPEISTLSNPDQVSLMNPDIFKEAFPKADRVLQLNKEVYHRASRANAMAARMLQLVSRLTSDPRGTVIARMAEVTKESLQVSKDALELSQEFFDLAKKASDLASQKGETPSELCGLIVHEMDMMSRMNAKSNLLQDRRDQLFEKYDKLSSEYEAVGETRGDEQEIPLD